MPVRNESKRVEEFSELVAKIYAAGADPGRWTEAVGAVAQALQASRALLFTPFSRPEEGGLVFPWRIDELHMSLWSSRYIEHDLWAQAARRKGLWREGAVLTNDDLVPQEVFRASVFYREFLSRMDIAKVCAGVVFCEAPGLPGTSLSVFRGARAASFSVRDRRLMQLLVPHLASALGLMQRMSLARHQAESMRAALNRLSIGVLLLNQEMGMVYANLAGQQVLARGDGLGLDRHQKLHAPGLSSTKGLRLEHWLTRLVALPAHERSSLGDTFEVARSGTHARYSVQCCPLEPLDPLFNTDGAHHIVFVTDPHRMQPPAAAQLQRQLGLTPAEAKVSQALVQGQSYRGIASALGVSEETVRTQVKAVYAKTRTSNKAALTRLVLSMTKAVL